MKKLIERITRRGAGSIPDGTSAPPETPEAGLSANPHDAERKPTAPKLPPELPLPLESSTGPIVSPSRLLSVP